MAVIPIAGILSSKFVEAFVKEIETNLNTYYSKTRFSVRRETTHTTYDFTKFIGDFYWKRELAPEAIVFTKADQTAIFGAIMGRVPECLSYEIHIDGQNVEISVKTPG